MSDAINIPASVKARLKNVAKKLGISFNSIIQLYVQERLLYRISISKYRNMFLLKGGLLLYSLTEFKGRPTKDIDFLVRHISNDQKSILKAFKDICSISVEDGVEFDIDKIKCQIINEGADYEGIRVKIIAFIGKARIHIQIDTGFGDVIVPKPVEILYPVLLDYQYPEIKVYSLYSVIAEKFEAMVSLSVLNSRMKDFYDVYMLLCKRNFDGRVLQEAIFKTFQRRATILERELVIFSGEFMNDSNRIKQWELFLSRIGSENILFQEVITEIDRFLLPIYNAIIMEEEFLHNWNFKKKNWL